MNQGDERPLRAGRTARLRLEPLEVAHATEMVTVLAAPELYEHTGGKAPTVGEVRERYARLSAGSPEPDVRWCNWILRALAGQQAIGYVQATLDGTGNGGLEAELAWVVGVRWQRQGYATEAGRWLLEEVRRIGVRCVIARIDPANMASAALARRLGLEAGAMVAGEREWVARSPG